ncbi:hypothetical protein GPZ77_00410 [Streptomyces sp. QHH-9511]|uniref:hypothetical protein n=1 Tax=Streptomyces sp. QHH-9511 TaxID=2684468 RepID=UPI001317520C|nr:hypothetical protein [Streptomyces sp. QHH-9511]QGZ47089.1 hypothetical protein GPZ77_00410 [Streptomyces sp. QHH-9511]
MSATEAPRSPNAEEAGRRVEEILDRLTAAGDPAAAAVAEELIRVLMDFYGAGLARIVTLLQAPAARTAQGGPLSGLLGDELVTSLLVLHDLHPEDTSARISRALESVREHGVELLGFDDATGTLRLRSTAGPGGGSGCGCPGTGPSARQVVEDALACFAPEVSHVELEEAPSPQEPALLQIGARPPTGTAGRPAPAAAP